MAHVIYIDPIEGTQFELDFAGLVTLIKGSSISSLSTAEDVFEIGLTDAFNLRIFGQINVELISTLNRGGFRPSDFKSLAIRMMQPLKPLKGAYMPCVNSMLLPS